MRKVALVFVLAVFVPSLVLAWLAVRSLRDQQFLLERQQSLLYQGIADGVAKDVQDALNEYQHTFADKTGALLQQSTPQQGISSFDELIGKAWPLAQVGFVVSPSCTILSPSPSTRAEAHAFLASNSRFLGSREAAEVYSNLKQAFNNTSTNGLELASNNSLWDASTQNLKAFGSSKGQLPRSVIPQQQDGMAQKDEAPAESSQYSKLAPAEAEFRQLIGQETEGTMARFVDNKLSLLFWCRPAREPQMVFGVQVALPRLKRELGALVGHLDSALRGEVCLGLLDDAARPVALSHPTFQANWKRPFVATEIGEVLPPWEVG